MASHSPFDPTAPDPPSAHASSVGLPKRASSDLATRKILEQDIGVEAVVEALEFATYGEPDDGTQMPSAARQLLDRLNDPRLAMVGTKPVALTTLMREAGMSLPALIDLIRKKDLALAVVKSGRHLGEVIDGLGLVSKARWKICERCWGEGEVEKTGPGGEIATADHDEGEEPMPLLIPCPALCDHGKVLVAGNLDAAKLFTGIHGLGPKGGGSPSVVVNANAQAGVRIDKNGERDAQRQETVTSRVQELLERGDGGGSDD